jgi:hypothetical protein
MDWYSKSNLCNEKDLCPAELSEINLRQYIASLFQRKIKAMAIDHL